MLQPLHSAYHFYTTVPFFFCITSILYPLIARRLRPIRDATEKVLFTCKSIQNKVCLLISQYYILHVKLVFQWRPVEVGASQPRQVWFSFDNTTVLSISELSPCVPRLCYIVLRSCIYQPHSLISDIYRRIYISVMMGPALRTIPLS